MNKIAIIGFSGSFPGAKDTNALWELTSRQEVGIKPSNLEDINENLPEDLVKQKGFRGVGGGPSDFKSFDASFFGYSPKEAQYLDPQIRKSLEYAWKSIEHAGYCPDSFKIPVGVYVASSLNSYFLENLQYIFHHEADEHQKNQMIFLNEPDFLASRLSYHFNWHGPAFVIKCGCSGSLVAIHEACTGLINFDCDIALSGGVAIKPRYHYGYLYEEGGILSADGKCCPFSDTATGTVFANGIGFVVLKRLKDAISDGDTIYGIIRGSAINNDGHDKVGYMAPSVSGQANSLELALAYAGIEPEDISYIEAHGTGTEIGDPIEYKGLLSVFSNCQEGSIALTTVKGNVGHLDAASGVTGLIKVLLDLQHHTISPIANFSNPNPKLHYNCSPITFTKQLENWDCGTKARMAVVNSFGIGGTNAHLIIEEYKSFTSNKKENTHSQKYFIPISAKSPETLNNKLIQLTDYLQNYFFGSIGDLSYTLLLGRKHFQNRWGCIVESKEDLLEQIHAASAKDYTIVSIGENIHVDLELFHSPKKLATLWLQGANIANLNNSLKGYKRIAAPVYCFLNNEYWINPMIKHNNERKNEKIADISKWFYAPYWKREQVANHIPKLSDKNILVLSDDSTFSATLVNRLEKLGAKLTIVSRKEIDLNQAQPFIGLLRNLVYNNSFPDIVLHLWCLGDDVDMQKCGLFALIALCQDSINVTQDISFHLSIIADGVANVSGCEHVNPYKLTLLGISQVLPKEYEKARCQLIDINTNVKDEINIDSILYELATNNDSEVALRGTRRFIKDYTRIELGEEFLGKNILEATKNYLIIGGLGNFGMELAEFIGDVNKGRVFLTTRTNFPKLENWDLWLAEKGLENSISKKILYLKGIMQKGADINILKGDVTNRHDLEVIKHYIEQNYGSINGVIHAAGIVESGMLQNKTRESLNHVFAAKIQGTENVCKVFLPSNPDFIILCSSMNAIIGGLGQIDNTAANAFVDGYAEYCLNNGHDNVLAINWGAVNEARARNYSALPQFAELSREHIKNRMTKDETFDVYRRIFSSKILPRIVISTIDFNEVVKNWNRVGSLQALLKQVDCHKKDRQEVVQNEYKAPNSSIEVQIAKLWQELLGITQVGLKDNFFELGGNSLIAIQFIGKLTNQYPIKMHAMSIYEYPSLLEFSAYVEQLVREAQEKQQLIDG